MTLSNDSWVADAIAQQEAYIARFRAEKADQSAAPTKPKRKTAAQHRVQQYAGVAAASGIAHRVIDDGHRLEVTAANGDTLMIRVEDGMRLHIISWTGTTADPDTGTGIKPSSLGEWFKAHRGDGND